MYPECLLDATNFLFFLSSSDKVFSNNLSWKMNYLRLIISWAAPELLLPKLVLLLCARDTLTFCIRRRISSYTLWSVYTVHSHSVEALALKLHFAWVNNSLCMYWLSSKTLRKLFSKIDPPNLGSSNPIFKTYPLSMVYTLLKQQIAEIFDVKKSWIFQRTKDATFCSWDSHHWSWFSKIYPAWYFALV